MSRTIFIYLERVIEWMKCKAARWRSVDVLLLCCIRQRHRQKGRLPFYYTYLILGLVLRAHATELSPQTVLQDAFERSPELQKSLKLINETEKVLELKRTYFFPTLDGLASLKSKDDSNQFGSSLSAAKADYDGSLRLVQPLYKGGALTADESAQKIQVEIEKLNHFIVRQELGEVVLGIYLDLVYLNDLKELNKKHLQMLENYLSTVKSYERLGRARQLDRIQAEVNLSVARADSAKWERDFDNVVVQYCRRVDCVSLPSELITQVPTLKLREESLEAWLKYGLEFNPELLVLHKSRVKTEFQRAIEISVERPSLQFEAYYGIRAPEFGQWMEKDSTYYSFGLTLKVPLFSGNSLSHRQHIFLSRSQREQAQIELSRQSLQSQIRVLYQKIDWDKKRIQDLKSAEALGEKALDIANKSYSQGIAIPQDVLNAQKSFYEAKKTLLESQNQLRKNGLALSKAAGIALESLL